METRVKLEGGEATVTRTQCFKLPFFLEGDPQGGSWLSYDGEKYRLKNRLGSKVISDVVLTKVEAEQVIKETLEGREE